MKKNNNKKLYAFFVILSLMFGITFSILIPLYQVPDEEAHIEYIYSYLEKGNSFLLDTNYYGDTSRITGNYDEKVDLNQYLDFSKKLNVLEKITSFDIRIIRYFPQTVGLLISELMNFPIIVSVTICEILAVLFYTFIGLIALKLMPVKKEIFMAIMLLPISVQQMGSFSYDMMLNSISFLFIAYIFKLKYENKKIKNKNIIVLILLLGIIALIKIPYILLGLLLLLLPLKNYVNYCKIKQFMRSNRFIILILFIFLFIAFLLLFCKYIINIKYIKVLLAFISNPIVGIRLIVNTIINNGLFYLATLVECFGWFDTPISIPFGIFVVVSLLIIAILSGKNEYDKTITRKNKFFLIFYITIFCIIIIISMFDWTLFYLEIDTLNYNIGDYRYQMSNIKEILGVQGRYFIPILPLLIPFSFNIKLKKKEKILKYYQILYYSIVYLYMITVILKRYWIY